MLSEVHIFVFANDNKFIENMIAYFKYAEKIEIIDFALEYTQAKQKIKIGNKLYNVIILDADTKEYDLINLLMFIHENDIDCHVIVLLNNTDYLLITKLKKYEKIVYVFLKPINFKVIEKYFNSFLCTTKLIDSNKYIDIMKLLHDMGVPSHIKGYQYLKEGIYIMCNRRNNIFSITNDIYPRIASMYSTTCESVERSIRHAIEISWNRGDYDLLENLFGHSVSFDKSRPTNYQYISTVADQLTIEDFCSENKI